MCAPHRISTLWVVQKGQTPTSGRDGVVRRSEDRAVALVHFSRHVVPRFSAHMPQGLQISSAKNEQRVKNAICFFEAHTRLV